MKNRRLQRSDAVWLGGVGLLVMLQFWWLPGDPGTPDDTYSTTIEGKRGFFQTLEDLATAGLLPPVRREPNRLIPDRTTTLVVLSPDRYPNEREQQELADYVSNGGTLLFAPNWTSPTCSIAQLNIQTRTQYYREEDIVLQGTPSTVPPVTVPVQSTAPATDGTGNALPAEKESADTQPLAEADVPAGMAPDVTADVQPDGVGDQDRQVDNIVRKAVQEGTSLQPPTTTPMSPFVDDDLRNVADFFTKSPLVKELVPWRTRASLSTGSKQTTVLVESASGIIQAAAWKHGNGMVVVSASADVFSNRAMLDGSRAELAVRLLEYAHSPHASGGSAESPPIVVSEFLNTSDAYRGTAVLMSPTLRSGTLQLLMVAVLAGWFGFHRFGPARRVSTMQRRSLTESAAAVGNLQFRTDGGREALLRYMEYFRTQLQRYFGRSVQINDYDSIARRAGMDTADVARRITQGLTLTQQSSTSASHAAHAIRELSQLLNRLSGSHRDK